MAASTYKREMDDTADMSETSSLILCMPPPFKHKKLREATSTVNDEADDCDLVPSSQKPSTQGQRMGSGSASEDACNLKTPQNSPVTKRDVALDAEIVSRQGKRPEAPPRPRASSPIRPSLYNSYFDDDEDITVDESVCQGCAAKPGMDKENAPHVKRLLSYGESAEEAPSTSKASRASKVPPGGVLESCVMRIRSNQLASTPKPPGLRRPDVRSTGACADVPRFARNVTMYTDRPGNPPERRDRYSGLRRGAVLHIEMSPRKHIILKK